ncbi:flavodoxin domain-containing protein [Candidatus Woesearchaeota archaeon]|nr:flavodoxin domain-containing protein [Candidatus Woesearchaeota archaeon]
MKALVAFYSRGGHTRRVGEEIARNLKAQKDEIIDLKDRSAKIISWIVAAKDAFLKKSTKIKQKKDPSKYPLVIIGTPVWAGSMAPAVRAYLNKNKFRKVAFFCTCGGNQGKVFGEMEKLSKKPLASLELRDRKIKDAGSKKRIRDFCAKLKK